MALDRSSAHIFVKKRPFCSRNFTAKMSPKIAPKNESKMPFLLVHESSSFPPPPPHKAKSVVSSCHTTKKYGHSTGLTVTISINIYVYVCIEKGSKTKTERDRERERGEREREREERESSR